MSDDYFEWGDERVQSRNKTRDKIAYSQGFCSNQLTRSKIHKQTVRVCVIRALACFEAK